MIADVTNAKILSSANSTTMETMVHNNILSWFGQVSWMNESQIPKQLPFGELAFKKRDRGCLCKQWMDCPKEDKIIYFFMAPNYTRLAGMEMCHVLSEAAL